MRRCAACGTVSPGLPVTCPTCGKAEGERIELFDLKGNRTESVGATGGVDEKGNR